MEKDKIIIGSIKEMKLSDGIATLHMPTIKNGSIFTIGEHIKTEFRADQHFNWFQKLMWKWCFGVKIKDYSEE